MGSLFLLCSTVNVPYEIPYHVYPCNLQFPLAELRLIARDTNFTYVVELDSFRNTINTQLS